MEATSELTAGWLALLEQEAHSTGEAADRAMAVLAAIDRMEAQLTPIKEKARGVLSEIVAEVGEISTAHGKAAPVKGSVRTTWDTKGLTRLMDDVAAARTLLSPYLRTTEVAPTIKITMKKGAA
jgi:hypothetical protein